MKTITQHALNAIAASHRRLAEEHRSLAEEHRRLAEELERLLDGQSLTGVVTPAELPDPTATVVPPVWDPETDEPLVRPQVYGTREEQDWCSLTYLGGIYAINRRYERGASAQEIRHYAIKAGYRDGRAVTAWSKGTGPTYNDGAKRRWIKPEGADYWVKRLAAKLGVTLPDDLAGPWTGGATS